MKAILASKTFWGAIRGLIAPCSLAFTACSKKSGEPDMFTGKVYSSVEVRALVPGATLGKNSYAQVNRAWVEWFYSEFRSKLSEGQYGVVHWDGRFTCTSFTTKFCGDAQMRYFAQSFHSRIKAPSAGIGEFWYHPGGNWLGNGHALVICLTENGREFFEPQTGKWVSLTPAETTATIIKKFD